MKILKFINFLPIIAIVGLTWYSLQPKTSRETVLSVPGNSATIQIPNGEPDPDPASSLPEYEVIPGSVQPTRYGFDRPKLKYSKSGLLVLMHRS